MASPPPAERPAVFALDTLILRAAARAVELAQRRRIAFSIEAVHLAAALTGDLPRLERGLAEWLEPAIRSSPSTRVTLCVAAAVPSPGRVQVRCELIDTCQRSGTGLGRDATPSVVRTDRAFTMDIARVEGGMACGPLDGRRVLLVHDVADADADAELGAQLTSFGLRIDHAAPGAAAIDRYAVSATSRDGAYAFVLLAGAAAGGPGLATAEALTASAGALLPAFLLLDGGLDAVALSRLRALDAARVPAVPLIAAVLHGQLLRLLLDQADVPVDVAAGTAGLRVLVAEDHTLSQFLAVDMLESLGLDVEVVGDGAAAVRVALERRHDLVLMDVQMPGMDGLEATRRLRARPELAGLPILAMTANAYADNLRACREAGMNDHLVKPVDLTALRAMLARWLPRLPTAGGGSGVEAGMEGAGLRPSATPPVAGIDRSTGLRFFADDPVAYRTALGRFAALYAHGLVEPASPLVEPPSREQLQRALHSLAGAATAVGASNLQREATALETGLADPGRSVDRVAMVRFDTALRHLAARITAAIRHDAP